MLLLLPNICALIDFLGRGGGGGGGFKKYARVQQQKRLWLLRQGECQSANREGFLFGSLSHCSGFARLLLSSPNVFPIDCCLTAWLASSLIAFYSVSICFTDFIIRWLAVGFHGEILLVCSLLSTLFQLDPSGQRWGWHGGLPGWLIHSWIQIVIMGYPSFQFVTSQGQESNHATARVVMIAASCTCSRCQQKRDGGCSQWSDPNLISQIMQ